MDDADSSYNLEIRIVSRNCRGRWYELSKVVDADRINLRDLIDGVVDKYPHGYLELVKVYYFALDRKVNIELRTDQDLLHMFEKHSVSKCCFVTFAYYKAEAGPPRFHYGTLVLVRILLNPHSPLQILAQAKEN